MTQQAVAQIIPNIGNQEAAAAGNSAVIFTATDRELIEQKSGKIDKNRSFIDLLKDKPLTAEIENEESNAKEHQDVKELEGRFRDHRRSLKHSPLYTPREEVEIKSELPDKYEESSPTTVEPKTPALSNRIEKEETVEIEAAKIKEEPAPAEKKSRPDPGKVYDGISAEQKALHSMNHRIKVLHLKRLLSENENQFKTATQEIKEATLRPLPSPAKAYIEAKLNRLTFVTARYKLSLLKSLESLDHDPERRTFMKRLEKIIADLS
jgi:hypothetical protein